MTSLRLASLWSLRVPWPFWGIGEFQSFLREAKVMTRSQSTELNPFCPTETQEAYRPSSTGEPTRLWKMPLLRMIKNKESFRKSHEHEV